MRDVAAIATGWSPVARRSIRSIAGLTLSACEAALAQVGLTWKDVDGLATYPSTAGSGGNQPGVDMVGVELIARAARMQHLRWFASLDRGMVSGSFAAAVNAIATGQCDVALVFKAMHTPERPYGEVQAAEPDALNEFTLPYGVARGSVAEFAMPYGAYLERYGRAREEFAPFIVQNRANAAGNPRAVFYQRPITVSDYVDDRVIATPLSMLDCDMPVDGAVAVLLATREVAAEVCARPAYVLGHATMGMQFDHAPLMVLDDLQANARWLTRLALDNAKVKTADLDRLSLYDGYSYFVLLWLEALGVCGVGEALDYLADGVSAPGGQLPLNTGGGALGIGRLHGMPQLAEAVEHIIQPEGVDVTLAHAGSPVHGGAMFVFGSPATLSTR